MPFLYRRVLELPETIDPNEVLFYKKSTHVSLLLSDVAATTRFPLQEVITLIGPTDVGLNAVTDYEIQGYSSAKSYSVHSTNGLIDIEGALISFTPDGEPGEKSFTVNDQVFTVNADYVTPSQPEILAPVNGAEDVGPTNITLIASDFSLTNPNYQDTHLSTDWEVATDPAFTNIVASSYDDTVNKTSWTIPD